MEIFLYIYIASVLISGGGSIYEWCTEDDHKGWSKANFFVGCFVPVANTLYSLSMFVAFFKWIGKSA